MNLNTAESSPSSTKEEFSSPTVSARLGSISPDRSDTVVEKAPHDGVNAGENGQEYVQGVKLMLVLVSTTVVYFLMMLDMSILATVGFYLSMRPKTQMLITTPGNTVHHRRLPLTARYRMVRKCVPAR